MKILAPIALLVFCCAGLVYLIRKNISSRFSRDKSEIAVDVVTPVDKWKSLNNGEDPTL
jgi:hypothetical protein